MTTNTSNQMYRLPALALVSKIITTLGSVCFVLALAYEIFKSEGHDNPYLILFISFTLIVLGEIGLSFSENTYTTLLKEGKILPDSGYFKEVAIFLLPMIVYHYDKNFTEEHVVYVSITLLYYFTAFCYLLFLIRYKLNRHSPHLEKKVGQHPKQNRKR